MLISNKIVSKFKQRIFPGSSSSPAESKNSSGELSVPSSGPSDLASLGGTKELDGPSAPRLPAVSLEEASRQAAHGFISGGCSYHLNGHGVGEWDWDGANDRLPEVLDSFQSVYAGNSVAEDMIEVARTSRALAPVAIGALYEGATESNQLAVGLAMIAHWSGEKGTGATYSGGAEFPTRHAENLLRKTVDLTGDEKLQSGLLDRSPANLRTLASGVLSANGMSPRMVLAGAMVPLTDGILQEMGPSGDPLVRGRIMGGHYQTSDRFLGNQDEALFRKFQSHYIQDIVNREGLWPEVKAGYPSELPPIENKIDGSSLKMRARAAVNFKEDPESAFKAIAGQLTGAHADLAHVVRSQESPANWAALMQGVVGDVSRNEPDFRALARVGVNAEAALMSKAESDRIRHGVQGEPDWNELSASLTEKLVESDFSPTEKRILELNNEHPRDRSFTFLYLSKDRGHSPQEALVTASLLATMGPGNSDALLRESQLQAKEGLPKALLGLATEPGVVNQAAKVAITGGILAAKEMPEEKGERFLKRLGLHLVARETNPNAAPKCAQFLESIGCEQGGSAANLEQLKALASTKIHEDRDYQFEFITDVRNMGSAAKELIKDFHNEQGEHGSLVRGYAYKQNEWRSVVDVESSIFGRDEMQDEAFNKVWNGETLQLSLFQAQDSALLAVV